MQVVLPDLKPATFVFDSEIPMSDDDFIALCEANRDLHVERSARGEVIFMPPAGGETSFRNSKLSARLTVWAEKDGRGHAFDSSGEFLLPNGAARCADACWVSNNKLRALTKAQKRRFLELCPEFVIELASPTDRISALKRKMEEWIANGAALGWLIDPDERTVYVYRPGREPEELKDIPAIDGEGPVAGFRLELTDIWAGL